MSHSIMSPEVSFGVPVCNSFASLSDEFATPAVLSNSSDEESEKQRSLGGSDHSSDDLEVRICRFDKASFLKAGIPTGNVGK